MRESEPISYEPSDSTVTAVKESDIEGDFIRTLVRLKYTHRPDIHDRDALEANFREKFQRLNAVTLSDSEFARLLDQITTPDVYKSAEILRRLVFDGERLTDLTAPLNLGWKARRQRELALMADLVPLLKQRANGQDISGLSGYEH